MKEILKDKCFRLTIILTVLFLGMGFAFLHFEMVEYGWLFFILLPIVLGISIGAMTKSSWNILGYTIGIGVFSGGLIAFGLDGFICIIMALPIIIVFTFIGSIIILLIKKYAKIKGTNNIKILITPLIILFIGIPVENITTSNEKLIIEVSTEIILPYSTFDVYDAIKSVDTLDAKKPFLMKINLPIPQKCILEKEEVGALRTCYFEGGKIVERVTEIERGKILRMDVINYQLNGKKWLGFEEAIYLFEKIDENSSKLTRITTYTSKLLPRSYWQPIENIGIQQEHEYVFSNLKKDLKNKYNENNSNSRWHRVFRSGIRILFF